MIRRPPQSTLFPTRRSSDLSEVRRLKPEIGFSEALCSNFRLRPSDLSKRAKDTGKLSAYQAVTCSPAGGEVGEHGVRALRDRKSTRLNSSHGYISYAVFCLK